MLLGLIASLSLEQQMRGRPFSPLLTGTTIALAHKSVQIMQPKRMDDIPSKFIAGPMISPCLWFCLPGAQNMTVKSKIMANRHADWQRTGY